MENAWTGPTIEDNKFKYTYTADQAQASGYTLKLATENKFVDKDIWAKVIIGAGALSAGNGNAGLTNHGATGLLGTVTSTQPSSGHYLEITGNGYVKVSTAGWLAAHTNSQDGVQSNTDTKYYPIQSAVFGFGTGSNANKLYCTTSGYVAANSTTPIDSITTQIPTTSYSHSNTMGTYFTNGSLSDYDVIITPQYSNSAGYVSAHTNTNNGGIGYWKIKNATITEGTTTVTGSTGNYTATRGAMSVSSDGWISSSTTFPTTSFRNTPADGTTASNYVDISETSEAPILVTGDYLYITQGYTDNIRISLAKLVPDADQITGGNTFAAASYILTGYAAWNEAGEQITGSMPTCTLPTTTATSSSGTSKYTVPVSTSTRYINIPKGYNSAAGYYTIRPVSLSSSLTTSTKASNVKTGVTITVGDNGSATRLVNFTGTFTAASSVSSGQTAATYDTDKNSPQILSGYSAWVDGYELKGSIETNDNTDLTFNGSTRTFTAPAGFYATDATKQIAAATLSPGNGSVSLTYDTGTLSIYKSSSNTGGVTINDSAPAANSGKVYIKVAGSGEVSNTVGWLNTATSTPSNSKTRYVILNKYDGSFTTG